MNAEPNRKHEYAQITEAVEAATGTSAAQRDAIDSSVISGDGDRPKPRGALAGFPPVEGLPFPAYRASDIDSLADQPMKFLIRGFLADGTAGMWGGVQKTLKTELQVALDLSVVTGTPFLGHDEFAVNRTGRVLTFVGEGGITPYVRRIRRIAHAYGVDVPDDYIVTRELGAMSDASFIDQVAATVETIDPVLVRVDPYYAYHGGDTEAANLFQQGKLLSRFTEALNGRTFLLTTHFNERGKGLDLTRFTQAGSAQWVDSWVQVVHREIPNPETGEFRLGLKVGSRQWGERFFEIDVKLRRFDMDTGEHRGIPSWGVRRVGYSVVDSWGRATGKRPTDRRPDIVRALVQEPWAKTKSELVKSVGGKAEHARAFIDSLIGAGRVRSVPVKFVDASGRRQTHNVLGFDPEGPAEIAGVRIPTDYPEPPQEAL